MSSHGRGSARKGLWAVPGGVWALGFVSMFMDISSEMIHALLPVYLVTVLGTSAIAVGVIEGIAEATAAITKIFSGAISDWLGKRKILAVLGYGLAAFTKPVFPLAASIEWLVTARFVDRIGKGIRGAPRDALIADITPAHLRGASYGLRQSLDTVGAFVGPGLAVVLMWLTADNFKTVFWVAVLPAFLAVAVLVFAVREPNRAVRKEKVRVPLSLPELKRLGSSFWLITAVSVPFTLARFSEAFLLLKAQSAGMAITLVPLVLVVMNITYSAAAYPAGALSDRVNRVNVLAMGLLLLILADFMLAVNGNLLGVALGVLLWGLHMGFTQGLLASLVADTAPEELRGTAFGMFNMIGGLMLLVASILAGILWEAISPAAPFVAGAAVTGLALLGLLAIRWRLPELGEPKPRDEPEEQF